MLQRVRSYGRLRRGEAGFTLVELAILITIIAVFSIFAAERVVEMIRTAKFTAAAAKVAADVRYAQQLARTHNGWYGISFVISPTNQYTVYSTDGVSDTAVQDPTNPGQTLVINLAAGFGGVAISNVNIGGGNKVEFNPTGAPYTDKTGALLGAAGTVTLSFGGVTRTVTITPNTGRVSVL